MFEFTVSITRSRELTEQERSFADAGGPLQFLPMSDAIVQVSGQATELYDAVAMVEAIAIGLQSLKSVPDAMATP